MDIEMTLELLILHGKLRILTEALIVGICEATNQRVSINQLAVYECLFCQRLAIRNIIGT